MLEHVRIMELQIGRRIRSDECVHHIDGDRSNNTPSNLALMDRAARSREHREADTHLWLRDSLGRFAGKVVSNVSA